MDKFATVRLGDSLDMGTEMGPLIHSSHIDQVQGQLQTLINQGGTPHSNTPLPDLPGHFMAPTLVTGVSSAAAQDEIFGPVGTVHTYQSEAEMMALANGTPYGLEAYLFTRNEEKGHALGRKIHAGEIKINGPSILSLGIMTPRPAWGLSGMHEEGTAETFQFFCNTKVVGVEGPLNF